PKSRVVRRTCFIPICWRGFAWCSELKRHLAASTLVRTQRLDYWRCLSASRATVCRHCCAATSALPSIVEVLVGQRRRVGGVPKVSGSGRSAMRAAAVIGLKFTDCHPAEQGLITLQLGQVRIEDTVKPGNIGHQPATGTIYR